MSFFFTDSQYPHPIYSYFRTAFAAGVLQRLLSPEK